MGWISTVVLSNDVIHQIEDDPTFGKRVHSAVMKCAGERGPHDIGHYGQAIESHHNDGLIPVLVGHGTGRPLDISVPWNSENPEIDLLLRLAGKHGYTLRKKPVKK